MTTDRNTNGNKRSEEGADTEIAQGKEPEWADGLRQLYDSVVDEPLPDSFADLLSRFDEPNDQPEGKGA